MLPTYSLPVETDEYVGPLLTFQWDGVDTTTVDIAVTPVVSGTAPTFTAYPGPKVPTAAGAYLIQARKSGVVRDIGYLHMTDY